MMNAKMTRGLGFAFHIQHPEFSILHLLFSVPLCLCG